MGACFFGGMVRFEMAIPAWGEHSIAYWERERVTIKTVVVREPRMVTRGQEVILEPQQLTHPTLGIVAPVVGFVRVVFSRSQDFAIGDTITVVCTLGLPQAFDGFAYDAYLASKGIFAQCNNPLVEHVDSAHGSVVGWLVAVRHRVEQSIATVLPHPESLLAQGVLVGGAGTWPRDLQDAFRAAGISHIVALSGYNVTIIIVALVFLLVRIYASRTVRFFSVMTILALFLLMTGASASLMRAALMGMLVLAAILVGRVIPWTGILVVSAGILVALQPLSLLYDLGFQLSFAAMAGLIWCVPRIHEMLAKMMTGTSLPWWVDIATATVCATAATAPIIAHAFGTFAPYGFIVNMIVVPLVPVLMVGSCIALVASLLPAGVSLFIGSIIQIPYTFVIFLAQTVAHLPGASLHVGGSVSMLVSGLFFVGVGIVHAWGMRSRHATI